MQTAKLYQKFAGDIAVLVLTDTVLSLKGLLVMPVITKLLGASAYGIWVQALVTVSLLGYICELNLATALARFLPVMTDRKAIREGFFSVAILAVAIGSLLAAGIIVFREPIAATLFHDRNLAGAVVLVAFIVLLGAFGSVAVGFFRAFQRATAYAVFVIVREVGGLVILVLLVMNGRGIFGALVSVLIAYGVVDVVMFALIIARVGFSFPNFSNLRKYLRFSLPTLPNVLSAWLVSSGDRYVISLFLGTTAVGIYSASYSLGSAISYFTAPLGFLLTPAMSKLFDEDNINQVRTLLSHALKYFLMFAIPAVIGLALLARPVLAVLTTAEFVSSAPIIVPLIATGYLFWGVYIVYSQVFLLTKRVDIIGAQWLTLAALNIGLNIVFVPLLGIIGAAITTFAVFFIITVWIMLVSRRHIQLEVSARFLGKCGLSSITMGLIVWRLNPTGLVQAAAAILGGMAVYFAVMFITRGVTRAEFCFVAGFVRGLIQRRVERLS